jgi:hypothetical protein
MNTHPTTMKTWYWIIGIIVVSISIYYFFLAGPSKATSSSLLEQGPASGVIGSQVLNLLNQISSLKIDSTVFQSAVYKSLQDYSVAIPTENVGRPNPFAPIPGFVPAPSVTPAR